MNRDVRPLFFVQDVLVTSAEVDVGVGGIRARLGRRVDDGRIIVVEDLPGPFDALADADLRSFRAELALREFVGVRALHVDGTPCSVHAELAPGVPFERVFRALKAQGGLAPAQLVVDVARAAIPALQCFVDAPVGPDDVSMLVWARDDGSFTSSPRVRRVSPRTDYAAPEFRNRSGNLDERQLVFSLGVLAHHLYFGVAPYADAVVDRRRRRDRLVAPPVDALGQLIFQCTEDDPAHRPASLDEVGRRITTTAAQSEREPGAPEPSSLARTLFHDDFVEDEAVIEQVAMLDVDALALAVPRLHARPLSLREERIWLNGGRAPRARGRELRPLP